MLPGNILMEPCFSSGRYEYASKHRGNAGLAFMCNFILVIVYTQFFRIKGGGGSGRPITFESFILPQQTIYRWKENLTANRIHFKYLKNILISRFYEQFSLNDSAMAPERLFEKFRTLKI